MDRYELAWAAGFFDGEGWANAVAAEGRRTRQPQARVNQADRNSTPAVLLRLQTALGGLGRIGGPYVEEGRQDLYRWEVSSRGDVELLHHLLLPWLGQLKLLEFSAALDRAAATSRSAKSDDIWRSWAAGLYDGEGSTCLLDHRSHEGYRIAEASITQTGLGDAPEVLRRFALIVDAGHVNGPYAQKGATMDVYRWKANARADIESMIDQLWPWLGEVKRAQAQEVLDTVHAQPELPRGRPDWGNRKTHCIRGHEYATARVRPYVSRGKGAPRRDNHQCLVCVRDQARARRERKKRSAADDRRSLSESATSYLLK
ncbi:MAG TPA: hypothetical protein VK197_01520 [Verrucomicrobiae bacterium]|nr:hypothetical protein [Verrucomicrobiae bacterium]